MDYEYYKNLLPSRFDNMHKGDCGKILIIAGSLGMTGASVLCAKAALRSGSGLVTVATPRTVLPIVAAATPEIMTIPLSDTDGVINKNAVSEIGNIISTYDACAIGPGLRPSSHIKEIVRFLLSQDTPLVIDADGLNSISTDTDILKNKKCQVVITPHEMEFSRLTGASLHEIQSDRQGIAKTFATEYNCTVLLKGHHTVIADRNNIHINKTGNNGMASGGMGDVLTGIIASFIGQGLKPFEASALGAFLHGLSADITVQNLGEFSLIASDVVNTLSKAILKITN